MFRKAAEVAPMDASTWAELGAAQARCKDWSSAVQSLTRATQLDPGNKQFQTRLGFTLARGGWYEEALNTLVKCMPEAEARYNLSRMMQHNKQGDAADVQMRLAAQIDPTFARPCRAGGRGSGRRSGRPPGRLPGAGRPACGDPAGSPNTGPWAIAASHARQYRTRAIGTAGNGE